MIWAGLRLIPRVKVTVQGTEPRWILLIAAALLGHVLMDAGNSYGTHLFYPFSARWVYGDAVFVLEPWLWAILGFGVALNASRMWRLLSALLTLLPIAGLVYVGLATPGLVVAILATVGAAAIAPGIGSGGRRRYWPQLHWCFC